MTHHPSGRTSPHLEASDRRGRRERGRRTTTPAIPARPKVSITNESLKCLSGPGLHLVVGLVLTIVGCAIGSDIQEPDLHPNESPGAYNHQAHIDNPPTRTNPTAQDHVLLASAIRRTRLAGLSGDSQATDILNDYQRSGDSTGLLRYLVAQRSQRNDDVIYRDREIAYLAARNWEISVAEQAVHRILDQYPLDPEALIRLGHLCVFRGDLNAGLRAYTRVLAIADDIDVDSWRATACGNIAMIHQKQGDLESARDKYLQALEIFEALGQPRGRTNAYNNLGLIYRAQGDLGQARRMVDRALRISRDHGMIDAIASQLSHLGLIVQMQGDLDHAERLQLESLALFEQDGHRQGIAQVAGNLGLIYLSRDDLQQAERSFRRALTINESLGRIEGTAKAKANLGLVYQVRGQLDEAEELFRQALAIEQQMGRTLGVANQHGNLGLIHSLRGNVRQARDSWETSRRLFNTIGMPHMVAKVDGLLNTLGEANDMSMAR